MGPRIIVLITLAACGPSTPHEDGGGSESGGPSPRCADASIASGVVGSAVEILCDVDDDCTAPATGLAIRAYDRDPRLAPDDYEPSMLDPSVPAIASTATDGDGEFALELANGAWFLCAFERANAATCTGPIAIDAAAPLLEANFDYGNGSFWSVHACNG